MTHNKNFFWLDLLRGLAALIVFAGHLREICFKEISRSMPDLLARIVFFITGFGHEAVVIFFVLSGFLIIKSIHGSVLRDKWSPLQYANNRLSRLWVVLIPALLFGWLIDKTGTSLFPDAAGYTNSIKYFGGPLIKDKLSFPLFWANVFFLQYIHTEEFGSNGPLWSLSCEFWYYVIFPLFYFSFFSKYEKIAKRMLLAALGILFMLFLNIEARLYSIIWLMGGMSYWIYQSKERTLLLRKFFFVPVLIVWLFMLSMVRLTLYPTVFNDYSVALVFSLLVPMLTTLKMNNKTLRNCSVYLSQISFTLYVVHEPINLLLTSAIGFQVKPWSHGLFWEYLVLMVVILLYATAMWYLFERNTDKVKNWINLHILFKLQRSL